MAQDGSSNGRRRPRGLGSTGRRLWQTLTTAWALDEERQERLRNLCRLADELARLREALAEAPTLTPGSMGQFKLNPLFEQVRSHTDTLNRGLAQLTQSIAPLMPARSGLLDPLDRLRLCRDIRGLRGGGGPFLPCWRLDEMPDGAVCPNCNTVMHQQFSHTDEECSVCREARARRVRINAASNGR